jgi:hypothetical protein
MLYDPFNEPPNALKSVVTGQQIKDPSMKNNVKCKHDIIAEWCSDCKRLDTPSIRQVLLQENLAIMENILSWPTKENRTTSR